jgi:siroheme synthase
MAACVEAGIEYEVIPGVSAFNAVPAAAGIPLTCRGLASEVVVRSGHRQAQAAERTYVYFMTARHVAEAVEEMQADGLPGWTPVALVQRGTLPGQRVIEATLETIAALAAQHGVETPALLVAGHVVRLRDPRQLLPALAGSELEEGDA